MRGVNHTATLAQILRTAKEQFETGQRFVAQRDVQAAATAFDAMLFECARARRIVRDAPASVDLRVDRDEFSVVMEDVAKNRNVQEHWQDPINPRKPKTQQHTLPNGLTMAVDEVSLIIKGPQEIYKGKLNLYDVYCFLQQKITQMNK
ncbi:hypothetical protein [Bradyrhizobium oligotrophicum]|uniref:hypothetical protein n=1 Tax=Bradyrhizobium oligotrophicum TaxID=44255 RepID=UPI003EBF0B2E